jgi:hypothetical protein
MEEERKEDLLFLMSWIGRNPQIDGKTPLFTLASGDAVFLAGYDAGGSALILLGDSLSLDRRGGIKIRGLIAIESPLWSVYREDALNIPDLPPDAGWFESVRHGLNRWLQEMKPKKIAGPGQIPELSIPLLFLVSDQSRESEYQSGQYQALFGTFKAARGPAVLASADGAGPLDYSDFPVRYPIISALFPGHREKLRNNLDAPGETAEIITRFAAGILETAGETRGETYDETYGEPGDETRVEIYPLRKPPVPAGVHIRANNNAHW